MIGGFDNSVMVQVPDKTTLLETMKIMDKNHVHRIIANRYSGNGRMAYFGVSQIDVLEFVHRQFLVQKSEYWAKLQKQPFRELFKFGGIKIDDQDKIQMTQTVLDVFRKLVGFGGNNKPRNAMCLVDMKGIFVGWLSASNFIKIFVEDQFACLHEPVGKYLEKHSNIRNPVCVRESTSLIEILNMFVARKLHRVYVVNAAKIPIYVVTTTLVVKWLVKLSGL